MSYQFHISLGYRFTTLYIYPINSKCMVDSSSQSAIIHIKLKKHLPTDKENVIEQSILDIAFMRWKLMCSQQRNEMLWNHQKSWCLYFCSICVYNPSSVYLFTHVIWIIMNPSFYTLCIPVRCTSKPTKMNQLRRVDKPWKLIPTNFKDSTVCIQTKHKIIWLAWQDKQNYE